jgi:trehalose-phosphatase
MLDYDGTLAPFRMDRAAARPRPLTLVRLRALSDAPGTTLAIVSGRPLAELARLIGIPGLRMIGEHGWEELGPGRRPIRHPLLAASRAALARAAAAVRGHGWGLRLERKRTGLVLHTRGLPAAAARALQAEARRAWAPETEDGAVMLAPTAGGIELRAPQRTKGTAARSLIAAAPEGTLAVFVGDDHTDEDAFAVVRDSGFGVRVGAGRRASLARARLADCDAVAEFLGRWLRLRDA